MWLLIALLLWVPVGGQTDLTKSVITLKPPWVNIFQEEAVTFWCEAPPVPGNSSTQWFINGTVIQTLTPSYTIASASVNNSGEYKCQTGLSMPSDPVQLQIYRDWLLLQVYSRILTEGEPLTLKCHGWKNKLVYKVLFYQDGKTFKFCPRDSIFTIVKTSRHNQGIYHCSGMGKHRYRSKGVFITIRELFTVPMLRVSTLLPLREGNQVNLSCETKLLQQRPSLQLYFSFYMGNMTLLSRDTSSEYQILNAKREDSGFYWCEAVTDDGKVLKRSLELDLQVLDLQSQITVGLHVLSHLAPATMYLVSTVFYIIIHKDLQKKKKQNLDISLESGHEKKATSCHQKDKHLEEESQCQDEEGHPQESTPQKVPQEEAKPSECP